ncbi:unnamed protein product [Spodoptera littoralis]|uniref:Partial AB-hydrolase lipase domain-containing protein n=1 Tax=Spodoptera littoralis TaxID=7109 RepID=A0A9P0I1H8_SPOLI|nr:unnamed protein product [Spodoptera littoralis]CAH1639490.1 unnamed protein product [Spodoptera littoralis]
MAVLKFIACALFMVVAVNASYSVYQTIEKIKADGFEAEAHKVTTSDGYILEMHRIPHGRTNKDSTEDRPVVLVMHGFMSASQAFVMLGPDTSFAYHLADAGFDVWMGNARGNKNSRAHVSLNPDDAVQKYEFFDFSWEEIGMIDLPAMIDYILKTTGKDQLHYIGHSQGGTVFLVMASMLPEYNNKIASAHLCAGVGYQEYFPDEQLKQSALMTDMIYYTALQAGAVELFPPNSIEMLPDDIFQWPEYCLGSKNMKYMCQIFGITRITNNYNAATDQPGAALKQMAHYGQNIRDKLFRRYHYGSAGNQEKYGSELPPKYDLSKITTFVTMHYTLNDNLLDERDVLAMVADIPRAVARQVARTSFEHGDFVAAADAKELVTDYIIEEIKNAGQENNFTDNDQVIVVDSPPTSAPGDEITSAPTTETSSTSAPDDSPGGAGTIVLNVYLIVLSLYVMLK